MRCLTFKSKITSDKRFDCILNRFLIAIFGGLEQASDKLFLLVRDQWTEMSSLNHSRTSILSPLRPFCGSLFLLISHLWNLTLLEGKFCFDEFFAFDRLFIAEGIGTEFVRKIIEKILYFLFGKIYSIECFGASVTVRFWVQPLKVTSVLI